MLFMLSQNSQDNYWSAVIFRIIHNEHYNSFWTLLKRRGIKILHITCRTIIRNKKDVKNVLISSLKKGSSNTSLTVELPAWTI